MLSNREAWETLNMTSDLSIWSGQTALTSAWPWWTASIHWMRWSMNPTPTSTSQTLSTRSRPPRGSARSILIRVRGQKGQRSPECFQHIPQLDKLVFFMNNIPDVFSKATVIMSTPESLLKNHSYALFNSLSPDWFQLVGLIHDIGKIMALYGEPQVRKCIQKNQSHGLNNTHVKWERRHFLQWAVVGDTFPVGCKFQNSIVFRNSTFEDNPDEKNLALKYNFRMLNSQRSLCILLHGN